MSTPLHTLAKLCYVLIALGQSAGAWELTVLTALQCEIYTFGQHFGLPAASQQAGVITMQWKEKYIRFINKVILDLNCITYHQTVDPYYLTLYYHVNNRFSYHITLQMIPRTHLQSRKGFVNALGITISQVLVYNKLVLKMHIHKYFQRKRWVYTIMYKQLTCIIWQSEYCSRLS